MTIWRLVSARYARVAYDGGGGLVSGGRWHEVGHRVAYASEHAALAVLEKLVWIDDYAAAVDAAFSLVPLTLDPERHLDLLETDQLPADWDAPEHTFSVRQCGTQWLREDRSPVLSVPSVLLPIARNFLVNPLHPAVDELEIGNPVPFEWDARLMKGPF